MKAELKYFQSFDGLKLYYEHWVPENPQGLLVLVHGLTDHAGRYGPLVRYFYQKNIAVALFDQRGHGHSEGVRGHCEHFYDYLQDLSTFIQMSRDVVPNVPIYLLGHSFGGQIVVNFIVRFTKGIRGVILSSPSLSLNLEIPKWKMYLAEVGEKWIPKLKIGHEIDPKWLSHDEEVVKRYTEDPLIFNKITLRLGREIMRNLEILQPMASRIYIPSLFMHGADDKICSPEATRKFFMRVPIAQKQLKIYPDMAHEIFNEVDNERVFNDMSTWMNALTNASTQIAGRRRGRDLYDEEDSPFNIGV